MLMYMNTHRMVNLYSIQQNLFIQSLKSNQVTEVNTIALPWTASAVAMDQVQASSPLMVQYSNPISLKPLFRSIRDFDISGVSQYLATFIVDSCTDAFDFTDLVTQVQQHCICMMARYCQHVYVHKHCTVIRVHTKVQLICPCTCTCTA